MSQLATYLLLAFCYLQLTLSLVHATTYNRAIDASIQVSDQSKIHYAYGPSLTYEDDSYHMIYCSNGHPDGYPKSWDYLRYSISTDGVSWQNPSVVLEGQAGNNQIDLAACLGSVVYYQNHYYLFYESARRIPATPIDPDNPTHGTQTVIQVARANQISGPYFPYNERGNWDEVSPPDAKPIIVPLDPSRGGPTNLGAGKPSVVVHNNTLHLWYTDDTLHPHGLYHLQSTSPELWIPSADAITNVYDGNSATIKYDTAKNRFIMLYIDDYLKKYPSLESRVSTDGQVWSLPATAISAPDFPFYAHSPGLAADKYGHLLPNKNLLGFGACPTLYPNSYCDSVDLYDLYTTNLGSTIFAGTYDTSPTTLSLKNPGLETGVMSSWHQDPSQPTFLPSITSTSHTGQHGLTLSGATGVVYQDIGGLTANTQYTISTWATAPPNNTSTIHFWLYDLGSGTTISESVKYTPDANWQQFSTTFTTPPSGTLRIHVSYLPGTGNITIDDFNLAPTSIPGDLNADGKVDIFDYQRLITGFGNPYTIFDYQKVISNFGR